MASEPTYRVGDVDHSKQDGIPRVISMPVGANDVTMRRAPMTMPAVSRNPSIANIHKTNVNTTTISVPAPAVTSTASAVPKKASKPSIAAEIGESTASGRWTPKEHEAFLAGLKVYGREWKKVAQCIPTRSPAQIRSHAQKYFNKVSKEQQEIVAIEAARHLSCPASLTLQSETSTSPLKCADTTVSSSYHEFVKALSENPSSAESRVRSTLQSLQKRKAELENHLRRIKSEEVPSGSSAAVAPVLSMGPASAALQAEQQNLRKAAKARYEMKRRSRTPSPKESSSNNTSSKYCANISLATIPSSGEFDSGEVLALSLLGGNFKRDSIQNTLQRPPKSRKTEH